MRRIGRVGRRLLFLAALLSGPASAHLQCVPYARAVSGIAIHGDAATWWGKAAHRYHRGETPEVGAVLAFRPTAAMPRGHVAVVAAIVDDRHIRLNHANWSRPGMVERAALAEDVSEAGDWSEVRIWYAPSRALGSRTNPTFGFIYAGDEAMALAAGDADGADRSEDAASARDAAG